jgi:hypothetical protein
MTLTAGGGCCAEQVEVPCEKEGLCIVTGLISETGMLMELLRAKASQTKST